MEVRYYRSSAGRPIIESFIADLSNDLKEEFFECILKLEKGHFLSLPISRPLNNIAHGLHELRLKDRSGIYRIFYFIKVKEAIYIVHAFKKKTLAIPAKEINIVIQRIKEIK